MTMLIEFFGRDHNGDFESDQEITIRQALVKCNILPSTVIVNYQGNILPLSTVITSDIKLEVITVSSGG